MALKIKYPAILFYTPNLKKFRNLEYSEVDLLFLTTIRKIKYMRDVSW